MFLEFRRDVGLEMYVEQIYTNVMGYTKRSKYYNIKELEKKEGKVEF